MGIKVHGIRAMHKEKGLTQEAFADLAGIDRSYMRHIERGEKNITLTKIYQLSHALEVGAGVIFERLQTEE